MSYSDLSIIICTRDRSQELAHCLSKLTLQCGSHDEIIVVDNRPSNDMARQIALKFGAKYYLVTNGGKSTALNVGIKRSNSDIIAFLDDDCFVEDGWKYSITRHFEDQDIAYVSGLEKPYELRTMAQKILELKGGFSKGVNFRCFTKDTYKNIWWRGVPVYLIGLGGNSAVRKSAILKVGGFDEMFGPGEDIWAGESTEICYRLLQGGYTLVYDPEAIVLGKYVEEYNVLKHRLFSYGLGDMAIHTKFLINYGDLRSLSEILFYRSFRQLQRMYQSAIGKSKFPIHLIVLEWLGNILGPWAFLFFSVKRHLKSS